MKQKENKIIKVKSNQPSVKKKEVPSLALAVDKRIQTAEGLKRKLSKAK
jgi:hypothetical protein